MLSDFSSGVALCFDREGKEVEVGLSSLPSCERQILELGDLVLSPTLSDLNLWADLHGSSTHNGPGTVIGIQR